MIAPDEFEGKTKVYEETFVAPREYDLHKDAISKLQAVREAHPSSSGWVEIDFNVEQHPNGKWTVSVHHAKYE